MNFYKKLGEVRPNQLITTYGPGSIMDAVNDSLTVLDIEYWNNNSIGKEIRDARLASYMNVRKFYMPKTGGKEDIPVVSFPYYHVCSKGSCKFLFDMRDYLILINIRAIRVKLSVPNVDSQHIRQDLLQYVKMDIWMTSRGGGGFIMAKQAVKRICSLNQGEIHRHLQNYR